jgi:hypothetical protein
VDAEALLCVSEFSREVAVLQWPAQEEERAVLARLGLPRLLVLDDSEAPPREAGCLEDWTRLPVDARDLRARLATLAARGQVHRAVPTIDPLGRLCHRGRFAPLSPTEERLAGVLVAAFSSVVCDDELVEAGWPEGGASLGALRVQITRLRRRLKPLGLEIRSRRGVGHVMDDVRATDAVVS